MLSLLSKAAPIIKGAARIAGVLKYREDGLPVGGRKKRLAAALVALVVAAGWLNEDVAEALSGLILVLLEFAG